MAKSKEPGVSSRYGIGEWYGEQLEKIPVDVRRERARISPIPLGTPATPLCPFMSTPTQNARCNKSGGVCSLREYEKESTSGRVRGVGPLITTCPNRFVQDGEIFRWIGEIILETETPTVIGEVGFLRSTLKEDEGREVGRIDNILIQPGTKPLRWCAVEIQAVYFSGAKMELDFVDFAASKNPDAIFPQKIRRPDYRSSGPKRLMPQLQIKMPTLRRWGKKMAVVVDESFFSALGEMDSVKDITNADIAWFVVDYDLSAGKIAKLVRSRVQYTTLERAIEGLTAGLPVTLEEFETEIKRKAGL